MQRIWTCLIFVFMVGALTFSVARAEKNSPQNLTKEQQSKIQEVEARMSNLVDALADSKKEDYNTIIEDLASSDKIVSDAIYNFVLKCERPKIRVDLVGVLKKINPQKAAQVEQELLERCKNAIKPGMDFNDSRDLLWEMCALGPVAEAPLWELFCAPNIDQIKPIILQRILELKLPATRENILRLLESGRVEPVVLITSVAQFPDPDNRARKVLIPLLKHTSNIVRLKAFEALGKLKAPELYKVSIAKLEDSDVLVRQNAVEYLSGYIKANPEKASAVADEIIKKIPEKYTEVNEIIFKSYMNLLSLSRVASALEFLKEHLALEEKHSYRELFLTTLGEMGTAGAYEVMLGYYSKLREDQNRLDESAQKNSLALQMLIIKNMRHPADLKAARNDVAISSLIGIMRNNEVPDAHCLEACISLQVLTGKQIGLNPDVWEEWWKQEKTKIQFEE